MLLKNVRAKKINDSRSECTIEVFLNGVKASSPSGKSTGKYETPSYRKSLEQSIRDINSLDLSNIKVNKFSDLISIESFIKNKFKLKDAKQFGANALFALESAILKSLAKEQKKQLWQVVNPNANKMPVPVGNAVGGGLHSHNKARPEFQEFLIIPQLNSARENFLLMKQVHKKLEKILKANAKNDEGAWETSLTNEKIFKVLSKFSKIKIGTDVAASSFYKSGNYNYKNSSLDKTAQINYLNELIKKYNLFYIEDPLHEEDFSGFNKIKKSESRLVVGDDLTATQVSRTKKAISENSINAMIIKPNQNGSLLELAEIFRLCKKHNIKTIISHRSGETLDDALADYAFGFQADFIKCGIATKWREVKLKRLVEIEKNL